jgi:hypothetical protein
MVRAFEFFKRKTLNFRQKVALRDRECDKNCHGKREGAIRYGTPTVSHLTLVRRCTAN